MQLLWSGEMLVVTINSKDSDHIIMVLWFASLYWLYGPKIVTTSISPSIQALWELHALSSLRDSISPWLRIASEAA